MNSISQRIKAIADNEGIKITQFESKIGASKGVFSRSYKSDTDIQSKWITLIVENYPQYNAKWLLTGRGPMMNEYPSNEGHISTVAEGYANCRMCSEKDKRIALLEKQLNKADNEINRLWSLIECDPGTIKTKLHSA